MPDAAELQDIGPIGVALLRRARGTVEELSALLHDVTTHAVVNSTRVTFHCHCLKFDGNGRPRVDDLVSAISDHILDFAVPRSAIAEAYAEYERTGATALLMRLRSEATSLFTDLKQSGEGGELLLYVLANPCFGCPSCFAK